MASFDFISGRIVEFVNQLEDENDGSTLKLVIDLLFERARDNEAESGLYARLARKTMVHISPHIRDETIRDSEGYPIAGAMLFRKYLLNRCQDDFESRYSTKAAGLTTRQHGAGGINRGTTNHINEESAAAKSRRQALGVVRFIGELFNMQMLTERIMHECIQQLLANSINPTEEEIGSLCKLLSTVGKALDNPKARNRMDIYFERMNEMARGNRLGSRTRSTLLEVIGLRARHWQDHSNLPRSMSVFAPTTNTPRDLHSPTSSGRARASRYSLNP